MVAEPLVHKVLSLATSSSKKSTQPSNSAAGGGGDDDKVGILSFEAANAMSRAASLYRSLSDAELSRLLAAAPPPLVAGDADRLLALALAEQLDSLNRVAAAASRLGRRCSHPALLGFDHIYADLLAGRSAVPPFPTPDAAALVRKLDRLAAATAALYTELEALAELEHSSKRFTGDEARRSLEQKIRWRRHDVRRLRSASVWNWTYDKTVLLLARAVCAIYTRIRVVFGDPLIGLDCLFSGRCPEEVSGTFVPSGQRFLNSGPIQYNVSEGKSGPIARIVVDTTRPTNLHKDGLRMHCGTSPGRLFMGCLSLSSSVSWKDAADDEFFEDGGSYLSIVRSGALVPFSGEQGGFTKSGKIGGRVRFGPKSTVTSLAPPSTVGGSALALHYANIIIIIEKLLRYPHLVGEEARDDLYQMLPSSLRAALKKSLKSYMNSMAIYDAFLAHDWRETLEKILAWLAPMAHDMIRWQTERNFEQQQIVLKGNVLLLQTLYFADREKTEAVICELLVGLNYICRYEQQQNALLDCSSSLDFEDCMEWQVQ